jgi:hypothetical protein
MKYMPYSLKIKICKRVPRLFYFIAIICTQNFNLFAQQEWRDYNYARRDGSKITYNWLYNFDGQFTEMSLWLDFRRGWQYMQDVYKTKSHKENSFYRRFVDDDPFDQDGKVLADELAKIAERYQYDNAKVALSFVQSLPHDPDIGFYQRYAIECLIDRKGDCSDKSVLLMAILAYMGYETITLEYPTHLAVGISDYGHKNSYYGQRYSYNGFYFYYADANALGVGIGDENGETKFSKRPATINKGYIKESSINGQTYNTVCERCGGDGSTHEGADAGPFYCTKCNGRGRY